MKRFAAESLGDVLRRAIQESDKAGRYDEMSAINLWPAIIGPELASKMSRPSVRNGVMTIRVFAAPLRQELNMMRSHIKTTLNEELGKEIIKEIKFTG